MIQSDQPLPVTRRCELLKVARSTAYCRPGPVSHEDLVLMRLIDEIHLELPFYGSRRIRDELETRGHPVNRKRVQRLMRHMGVAALYPKRRTSAPGRDHKVYPYLLTGVSVERANQVWATDICYLPMAKGFMYLVAVMDWLSRRVGIEHPGPRVLRRGARGGAGSLRGAGDLQHRPRRTVHLRGVHRRTQGARGGDQHGRQGAVDRQCLH